MQEYAEILKSFENLHKNNPDRDSEDWYDNREQALDKSRWFSSYLHLIDSAYVTVQNSNTFEVSSDLDSTQQVFISSEEFPCLHGLEIVKEITTKINTHYSYTDHYGSSFICTRHRLSSLKGQLWDNKLFEEYPEVKPFIDFFTELGKEICIVFDHTYDTTVLNRNHYDYNDTSPIPKLCVSVGKITFGCSSGNSNTDCEIGVNSD